MRLAQDRDVTICHENVREYELVDTGGDPSSSKAVPLDDRMVLGKVWA